MRKDQSLDIGNHTSNDELTNCSDEYFDSSSENGDDELYCGDDNGSSKDEHHTTPTNVSRTGDDFPGDDAPLIENGLDERPRVP